MRRAGTHRALAARALIARAAHPSHGHILPATLTETGRALIAAAHERVRAVEAGMVAGRSKPEQRLSGVRTAAGERGQVAESTYGSIMDHVAG